ncbi:MAG: hypothetical protein BGO42_12165 [Flavobacterium sp. 40-81]|nr:MAG: hypothetical protein BGO42_12165 [Flavobacterium sp. 40-81]
MVTKNAIEFSSLRIGNLPDKLVKELKIAFFWIFFIKETGQLFLIYIGAENQRSSFLIFNGTWYLKKQLI